MNFVRLLLDRRLIKYTEGFLKENDYWENYWKNEYERTKEPRYQEKYFMCLGARDAIVAYKVRLTQQRNYQCRGYGVYKK